MDRLVVVGCGTVVPEGDRGGACFYAEMDGVRALLDCGPGAVQALARLDLPWAGLTHLILTHFHTDHVGAVPGLFFAWKWGLLPDKREAPLEVWGPAGTRRLFERLADALGEFLLDPGFPIRFAELGPGEAREVAPGLELRTHKTPHTEESLAVRLDGTVGSLGYTGDTGPSATLGGFLRGTDVLVAECSLTDDLVGDNHLSPTGVARLAAEARPRRLVLTHIWPAVRKTRDVPALVAEAGYRGSVETARVGLELRLGG